MNLAPINLLSIINKKQQIFSKIFTKRDLKKRNIFQEQETTTPSASRCIFGRRKKATAKTEGERERRVSSERIWREEGVVKKKNESGVEREEVQKF